MTWISCDIQPVTKDQHYVANYWFPFLQKPSSHWIANTQTFCCLFEQDQFWFPVTINDKIENNSYVCSPYHTYISYGKEELLLLRPKNYLFFNKGIDVLSFFLRRGDIDKTVHINNFLLSSNLYPDSELNYHRMTEKINNEYPSHAIIYRSLNEIMHKALLEKLKSIGYLLIPSRQIYYIDMNINYKKIYDYKNDLKQLEKSAYQVIGHDEIHGRDFDRILELYTLLYLNKYSTINPQFTIPFLKHVHKTRTIIFRGLRNPHGILDGFLGRYQRFQTATMPLLGYDTNLPQQIGLYRMLMVLSLQLSIEEGKVLHLSSGAANFKRNRGAKSAIEYSAVWIKNLPNKQKCAWKLIHHITNEYIKPMMIRNKY